MNGLVIVNTFPSRTHARTQRLFSLMRVAASVAACAAVRQHTATQISAVGLIFWGDFFKKILFQPGSHACGEQRAESHAGTVE